MRAFELKNAALAIVAEVWNNFPQYRQYIIGLQVRINTRLKVSAGRADSLRGYIELSRQIFSIPGNENNIRNTVLHEVAHVIANRLHGRRVGHGVEWKRIFIGLGGNGQRCHTMATPPRTTQRRYAIQLACCGAKVEVGPRRYKAWASNRMEYRHTKSSLCEKG